MFRGGVYWLLRGPAAAQSGGVRRWTLVCTGLMMLLALVACGNLAGCSSGGSSGTSVASSEHEGEAGEEESEEEYGSEEPSGEGKAAHAGAEEESGEEYEAEASEEEDYESEDMEEEESTAEEEESEEEEYEEEEPEETEEAESEEGEYEEESEEEYGEEEAMEEESEEEYGEEYEEGMERPTGEEGYGRGSAKPAFPEGSPQAAIYNLVLQIRGDLDKAELEKLISSEAKGDLALLRRGEVPEEKKAALKALVERLQFVGRPRTKPGGTVELSLQNLKTGQILRFVCAREGDRYVVESLTVIEPPRRGRPLRSGSVRRR